MEIIAFVEAPTGLVDIINESLRGLEDKVDHVYIGEKLEGMRGRIGAMDLKPDGQVDILIDLENCITNVNWCQKGMLYIPNTWYNILYAIYHERAHLRQLIMNPSLKDNLEEHLAEMEKSADTEAIDCLYEWSKSNHMPTLANMGWAGERIKKVLNSVYSKHPAIVDEEIDTMGTGAVARAKVAANASSSFETAEMASSLYRHIEEGHVGLKVNGHLYLNAEEFFCIDDHTNMTEEDSKILAGVMQGQLQKQLNLKRQEATS